MRHALAFSVSLLSIIHCSVANTFIDLDALDTRGFDDILNNVPSNPYSGHCAASKPPAKDAPFWMESIKHQGQSPFNPKPSEYKVFRNVKDFGALGDGVHDDTEAINAAISAQDRCGGGGCDSSTLSPAVVYFPRGTYLVSSSVNMYYMTQLIGDAGVPPTILASPTFLGLAVLDADPYLPGGASWFGSTNNFHKSIRNFVIDIRQIPDNATLAGTGVHWRVAQATSLINLVFQMPTTPTTTHRGVWMEDGSGGYMGDMTFNGGSEAISGGNQQFTVRNITVNNAKTGVLSAWNWGWTYQGIKFNNCSVGFDISTGGVHGGFQTTGAQAIIDADVINTPIFVRTTQASNGTLDGSIVLDNVKLTNVPIAVGVLNGTTVLAGTTSTMHIDAWAQGNVYKGFKSQGFKQEYINAPHKAQSLLTAEGKIVGKSHPQYADHDVSDFVSVRTEGAKGDGQTDDTQALQAVFDKYGTCKIIFLDAGFYVVTDTLRIPAGARVVGEAWTYLAGKGSKFGDQQNPRPVVRVGTQGSQGVTEITDIVFTTVGPTPGAIVVEWNVREPQGVQAGAGMWDTHIRLGGSRGTNLEGDHCPKFRDDGSPFDPCMAAFLGLHITPHASGYFEGTWVWLADHDLDIPGQNQITVFSGRGIYSESQGPVWMIGTAAEHHALYQYNIVNANGHYMGLIQTESPYYQPVPNAPVPFHVDFRFQDPNPFSRNASAWAVNVKNSREILIYGAGLYSFFTNYTQDCIQSHNCQDQILNVDLLSDVSVYSLSTVATHFQLTYFHKGVIDQKDNVDGFQSTATVWTR
ncbi:glycoside hydrolase family 55 protein [Crepidotus variabilis]|uniref:Glycoside hydrolase family 55 protein n=1 Tax=Crepidotus variabilis TaxID=179855 RepID=A0A9P6JTD7_9AGAR|nr:glycoside hydrolase family 55 protein [Crepidotus variabilis]